MVPETYITSVKNLVNIQYSGQKITKNLEFLKCTSY